jgi:hypothetical protein
MQLGFVGNVVRSLQKRGLSGSLPYALGRFAVVRRSYSRTLAAAQGLGAVPGLARGGAPVVGGLDEEAALAGLQRDSVTPTVSLPPELVGRLRDYARGAWWTAEGVPRFRLEDVVDGRLGGHPVVIADVCDPDACPEARQVATDPGVLALLDRYMGYRPIGVRLRMLYSWAASYTKDERDLAGQTVDYHFDVQSYNFVYANYYLTDTDERSGAHVMVDGSHRDKPVSWLLGSARQSDEAVLAHYGAARERVIAGPAGTGFLQDSSCYHKALAPVERDRLILQVRYY